MPPFLEYVHAGLSAIPIRADGSKAAAVPWRPFTARLPSIEEATGWEGRYEGVAIVCGAVSGNLELIDVDEPTLARPYLETVRAQDPTLYDRLCLIRTPRRNESKQGGCHVIYRSEAKIPGNSKLAMTEPEPEFGDRRELVINPSTGEQNMKPRTLIETRGEGGYFLTLGCSPRCHPTGNLYEHVGGPSLTELAVLTEAERTTLHAAARMFDRSVAECHIEAKIPGYERRGPGESPGDDYNARATWPEILEPHGWQAVGEQAGIKHWRRPGKSTGISATTGILSKAGNELLTVFSTNASPFEGIASNGRPGVCYSRFGAYACLNHGGDFEATARELVKLGYGTPAQKTERKTRVMKTTVADAEHRYLEMLRDGEVGLITLGIPLLDQAIGGGVEKSEMVVVGGLTGHGKTVTGLQASRAIVEKGGHVIMVSHEMGGTAIAKRMIASRTTVESRQWARYVETLAQDSKRYWKGCGHIFLLEQCRAIEEIEKQVEQIAAEFDVGLVVIDHAQLTIGKGSSRYEQLTDASGRFKGLATKHDCVVLVLSQLNREAAKVDEAGAHHLRESGALEQDADVVILVRWPFKQHREGTDPKRFVMTICKNRNRPVVQHQIELEFQPARQTIEGELSAEPDRSQQFDAFADPEDEERLR